MDLWKLIWGYEWYVADVIPSQWWIRSYSVIGGCGDVMNQAILSRFSGILELLEVWSCIYKILYLLEVMWIQILCLLAFRMILLLEYIQYWLCECGISTRIEDEYNISCYSEIGAYVEHHYLGGYNYGIWVKCMICNPYDVLIQVVIAHLL